MSGGAVDDFWIILEFMNLCCTFLCFFTVLTLRQYMLSQEDSASRITLQMMSKQCSASPRCPPTQLLPLRKHRYFSMDGISSKSCSGRYCATGLKYEYCRKKSCSCAVREHEWLRYPCYRSKKWARHYCEGDIVVHEYGMRYMMVLSTYPDNSTEDCPACRLYYRGLHCRL